MICHIICANRLLNDPRSNPILRARARRSIAARRSASGAGAAVRCARNSTVQDIETDLSRLLPPDTLKGIEEATALLADAIEAHKRICVIADYDCDGATACAVAVRGLRRFGAQVDYLVPNRFEYGYGLSPEIVAVAAQRCPEVLVTVDNGIASVEGVASAQSLGIDVLITD